MTEVIEILEALIPLLTGLAGLITTSIATYYAVKNFIANVKNKNSIEIWNLIMTIADAAMAEAEASAESGETKKQMVIDTVTAGCTAAGIEIGDFAGQLSTYIDDSIKFAKSLQKANENKNK